MNRREAQNIAWELYKIDHCLRTVVGADSMVEVANTALDSMYNILKNNPKIKTELDKWKLNDKI